jgi:hypothetical protein
MKLLGWVAALDLLALVVMAQFIHRRRPPQKSTMSMEQNSRN